MFLSWRTHFFYPKIQLRVRAFFLNTSKSISPSQLSDTDFEIHKPTKTNYMKQLILFLIATGCLVTSHSQTTSYTVSGRLTDKTSNEPVSEATITIKETGARTLSDASGRFKVVVNSLPVTVLITHVSFQNQELIAAHTNEIHIT